MRVDQTVPEVWLEVVLDVVTEVRVAETGSDGAGLVVTDVSLAAVRQGLQWGRDVAQQDPPGETFSQGRWNTTAQVTVRVESGDFSLVQALIGGSSLCWCQGLVFHIAITTQLKASKIPPTCGKKRELILGTRVDHSDPA